MSTRATTKTQTGALLERAKRTVSILTAVTQALTHPDEKVEFKPNQLNGPDERQDAACEIQNFGRGLGFTLDCFIEDGKVFVSFPVARLCLAKARADEPIDHETIGKRGGAVLRELHVTFNKELDTLDQEDFLEVKGCGKVGLQQVIDYAKTVGIYICRAA